MMATGAYNASSNTTMVIDADLYFGIEAAKYRKEKVKFSSAARRTLSKVFEYLCWVILSATLATAFEATWLQYVVLGVVMGNELSSIVANYFEAHGKHIKGLNIFKIISDKSGVDLQDVTIEDDKSKTKN